jgi:hypothetical protein
MTIVSPLEEGHLQLYKYIYIYEYLSLDLFLSCLVLPYPIRTYPTQSYLYRSISLGGPIGVFVIAAAKDAVFELDADLRLQKNSGSLAALLMRNRAGATLKGESFAVAGVVEHLCVVWYW